MRYCLFLILILFSAFHSRGQEFSYTQYDVKDGLAGSVVYCAAEDKDGFLWFGTESGLSRFDGTHFKNFTTASGLPDNEIIKLFVDSRNRVWIVPFRNSICYYYKGELHNQDNDPVLHRMSLAGEVTSVTEDKYGNIILTEAHGLHVIGPDQTIRSIKEMNGNPIVIAIGGGLNSDRLFTFFLQEPRDDDYRQYTIDKGLVYTGRRDFVGRSVNITLLTSTLNIFQNEDTLYFIPASGGAFAFPFPRNFNTLSKVGDSLFTLNTTDGAFMYDLKTRKLSAYFLKGQSVNAVFRDTEGNLWFMCAGGGIFRIGSLAFRNVTFRENNNLAVTCIQYIDGALYIGTEHACLWRSDPGLQRISKQKSFWHSNNLKRILNIVPLDKNHLLLGSDGGLVKLNHHNKDSLVESSAIKTITHCNETLLISSMERIELLHYPDLFKQAVIWEKRSTCALQVDSVFYIGTINGLYSIIPGEKPRFWGDMYPVLKARIIAVTRSPDGTLWICTSGQGIAGIKDGRLLYSITEKDGLTSNLSRTIFISGNDIWVGTDKGLNRVQPEGGHFRITKFGSEDGLSSDIINVIYVNKDDVYVGSANGLTHFSINQAGDNSFCKLRITSIQAGHHTWNYDTSGLLLPHRENSLRVDFAGISYRSAGGITYRYRLKGLNARWQTTRETFLSYPTLPSGGYELEITATNKFGVDSRPIHIAFTVEKLLWEKTWFVTLMGLIVAGTIWALVWLRIRQLHRKNAEKISINNRMAELEQMSLRAQMNPHFIFNSLNSIQKYVMEKDVVGANKFITDFSRLIRLTLEITSRSRISIDEEVRYLSSYLELEKVRFGHTFRYEITIGPDINRMTWQIPPMLLQPYVENSIRHGLRYREDDKGMITIRFMQDALHLTCIIEDNGVGRKLAQQYKSLSPIEYQSRGMTLTARRVEMMNRAKAVPMLIDVEDIETGDHQAAGTRIILCFPIQYVKTQTPLI
ncbi:histidine kinase [Flavitalea sp. BT771]|uniref:sensor histidine kinase n=1 Tax=Flavitalea sp. BT771 TaxID=3063329 RepID=UPI0026E2DBFC|nr:sensor histidine kinase [Flavitalea sp. BT771]MDO6431878.1 histidine kinase [Flavitalea sp. BT771]MDV6220787.1 histidine kinase [Flavitalea sp. BT771]